MGWRGAIERVIVTYVARRRCEEGHGGALNSGVESIITFAEL